VSDRSNRGFAAMDEEKQREIASEGGRAAHEKGTAHEFDSREAREAGRKGGETVSQDREHMAEIGRKGGESRGDGGNRGS
jgi:general stress protein YciG